MSTSAPRVARVCATRSAPTWATRRRVDCVDGRPARGRRGSSALGQRDRHAPAIVRVGCPIQIAPDHQCVDELAGGLLGDAEGLDDVAQR